MVGRFTELEEATELDEATLELELFAELLLAITELEETITELDEIDLVLELDSKELLYGISDELLDTASELLEITSDELLDVISAYKAETVISSETICFPSKTSPFSLTQETN